MARPRGRPRKNIVESAKPKEEIIPDGPPMPPPDNEPGIIRIPVEEFQPNRFQLDVLRSSARFKVLRWHRRARKTTLALNQLILAAAEKPNQILCYIAPTYKQAKSIIVSDPNMLRRYMPAKFLRRPFNETDLIATFRNGSILRILGSDKPDSLRGINANGVIFDEWSMQKPQIFTNIFRPILAQNGGWAQFQFTPFGRNHAYEFWNRCGTESYPDWQRFDLIASESGIVAAGELAQAKKEMGDDFYRQEFECAFLDSALSVFRGYELCFSPLIGFTNPVMGRVYSIGVDLGRKHDATVLTVIDIAARRVVYLDRITETDWNLQKKMITSVAVRYNNSPVFMDSTGLGDPIVEDLRVQGLNVVGYQFTHGSKRELIDGLRVAMAQRLVQIPEGPETEQLKRELGDFQVTLSSSGKVHYAAPEGEGYYDDCVISLALAVHGMAGNVHVPRETDQDARYINAGDIPANYGIG